MLLLGIDLGTSSVKVSVVDAESGKSIASAHYPETEAEIISLHPGWAEQSPDTWWEQVQLAIRKLHTRGNYQPEDIRAIGIAYQMHGLVLVDKYQQVLRNSIIWCDSRAVETGDRAFAGIGREKCLYHLLNSPGNFTASKLAWVKEHEPAVYEAARSLLLPGDFIAMKLTGEITTSISALSEGVFWDFRNDSLSADVMEFYGLEPSLVPEIRNVFSVHGLLRKDVAASLSLREGIPVSYKAGDQPNNALSLNVLEPGEVAATAGTSGVIYGVTDQLAADPESRINSFAHVNYTSARKRLGVLLCINGTGIMNRWIRQVSGNLLSYPQINDEAGRVAPGSDGLLVYPFGNGTERMLNNRLLHASMLHIDFNKHDAAHLYRASQEGIAFAFRYGLDIMRQNGMSPSVIRAGYANMFLSEVFAGAFVNTLQVPVQLYENDGSYGAAAGGGIGAGIYQNAAAAFARFTPVKTVEPDHSKPYEEFYQRWLEELYRNLNQFSNI